jgi:hypothetical protein
MHLTHPIFRCAQCGAPVGRLHTHLGKHSCAKSAGVTRQTIENDLSQCSTCLKLFLTDADWVARMALH